MPDILFPKCCAKTGLRQFLILFSNHVLPDDLKKPAWLALPVPVSYI
ncbi:MAG: hypothetical protein ACXWAB_08765 [Methylobacter sp.]